jgi:hypothetical protein
VTHLGVTGFYTNRADRILVMVDVMPDRIAAAATILDTAGALRIDVHHAPISRA